MIKILSKVFHSKIIYFIITKWLKKCIIRCDNPLSIHKHQAQLNDYS